MIIDLNRGIGTEEEKPAATKEPASKTWDPDRLIPPELREAIHDKKLAPEKKAKVVYQSSHVLMRRLLEDPKG